LVAPTLVRWRILTPMSVVHNVIVTYLWCCCQWYKHWCDTFTLVLVTHATVCDLLNCYWCHVIQLLLCCWLWSCWLLAAQWIHKFTLYIHLMADKFILFSSNWCLCRTVYTTFYVWDWECLFGVNIWFYYFYHAINSRYHDSVCQNWYSSTWYCRNRI